MTEGHNARQTQSGLTLGVAENENGEPSAGDASITEASVPKRVRPEVIRDRLQSAPVLDHENHETFSKLFDCYEEYADPQDIIEYDLVWNITVSKFEISRYRFMAKAATANKGLIAWKELYLEVHLPKLFKEQLIIEAESHARKCFSDAEYREDAYIKLEDLGYIPDGQAFALSLPALGSIERLRISAEKRYFASLKELEKRLAKRAAQNRMADSKNQ